MNEKKSYYVAEVPKVVEWKGEAHNLSEWARRTGINRKTLETRFRLGWPVEKALTKRTTRKDREVTKDRVYRYIVEFKQDNDGVAPTIPEMAEAVDCSTSNIFQILDQLEEDGLIERSGDKNSPRNIRVTGGKWVSPEEQEFFWRDFKK